MPHSERVIDAMVITQSCNVQHAYAETTHIFLKNKAYLNRKLTYSALPNQEVFSEMEEKYGEVEEMNICDNLGDHLVGNVYVKVSVALYSHTTVVQQIHRLECITSEGFFGT